MSAERKPRRRSRQAGRKTAERPAQELRRAAPRAKSSAEEVAGAAGRNAAVLLLGAGLGAAAAFIADPSRGRRRRSLLRDRLSRIGRKGRDAAETAWHDVANRTRGLMAEGRGWMREQDVDDVRLVERIRSKVGRVCSHPRAIDVSAFDGAVTLGGAILADEEDAVVAAVESVRGVESVTSELQAHESAAGVPWLQGEGKTPAARWGMLRWAPATQAAVAAAGLVAAGAWLVARR
jgi:osmotically-inducible protein OsmY